MMRDPGTIDAAGRRLVGPTDLVDALDQAAADADGSQVAVSTPDGSFIAVRCRGRVRIRRLNDLSGRSGSVLGTGEWLGADELAPSILWRPA